MNSIGEKLLNLRKGKHLSQEEAADKLGVTRQTISKWETEESKPDFDKVEAICNLYNITPSELFGVKETKEKKETKEINNANSTKKALGISGGILLYFIAVAWMVVSVAAFKINPVLSVGILLTICGIATFIIIYVCLVYKKEKLIEEKVKNPVQKSICDCLAAVTCAIYFIISFMTMAWHITWLIWIIYALVEEIVKLIFVLKENQNEE